jgi:hypothetical protein
MVAGRAAMVSSTGRTDGMMTGQKRDRSVAYAAVVTYLGGQAFDIWWHAKNVSLVPEMPVRLLYIHLGIYLGAALAVVAGLRLLRRTGGLLAGGLLAAGGLVQLAGFFLDMWEHGHGSSVDLYHRMLWYGFIVVAAGVARMEAAIGAAPLPSAEQSAAIREGTQPGSV